jgi:hypothetical protein
MSLLQWARYFNFVRLTPQPVFRLCIMMPESSGDKAFRYVFGYVSVTVRAIFQPRPGQFSKTALALCV